MAPQLGTTALCSIFKLGHEIKKFVNYCLVQWCAKVILFGNKASMTYYTAKFRNF